jgi:ATP-binding cassette subfamily B protein
MSAVERLEDPQDVASVRPDPAIEILAGEVPLAPKGRLRPLLELAPYIARYRGRAILALIALTVAAITTLLVPVAARRMIDFGFTPEGIALINSYFSVMIAVVAVLGVARARRE